MRIATSKRLIMTYKAISHKFIHLKCWQPLKRYRAWLQQVSSFIRRISTLLLVSFIASGEILYPNKIHWLSDSDFAKLYARSNVNLFLHPQYQDFLEHPNSLCRLLYTRIINLNEKFSVAICYRLAQCVETLAIRLHSWNLLICFSPILFVRLLFYG